MHRLFLGFSLSVLALGGLLTGCGQADKPQMATAQIKDEDRVPPGEAKPIPPGEAKPIPSTDPTDPTLDDPQLGPAPDTALDPDTLPVLPRLTVPTGEDQYEAALSRAFLLMAEKKDAEALDALKEAQSVQESEFVRAEIDRLQAKIARQEAARQAADDIREVLDAGQAEQAARLAAEALAQYGDSDLAAPLSALKRQADALAASTGDARARGQRFLEEAEASRKDNNLRSAVLAYEQAVASGADPGPLKDTYEVLRTKLARYDEQRSRAADFRADPDTLEQAVTALQSAAENWDTAQIRQEIAEAESALANRRDRVAIADFEVRGDIGVPRAGDLVADELVGHLRPRFDVVERSQVKALYAEMKLDHDALIEDDAGRTEFGKLARARYVVLGSVNRVSGIHINARLVDTRTGLVVQTARIVASNPEEMTNRVPVLGRILQMNDEEKREYEQELARQARPVVPAPARTDVPPPPPTPAPEVKPTPPPAPIVVYAARPPEFGRVAVADFDGFQVIQVGAPAPPPVVIAEAPLMVRDRAFFAAVELGDNCFHRGDFRMALRHFEFALALNPGHAGIRMRVQQCRPLCPPPVVVVPVVRPRLVVLPFAEFRDPFAIPSSISPGLGTWTAGAIAPYFRGRYDVVDPGEVYWWMGRLGLTMRDVMTDPYARLCLGRAIGARFFLMGSLREVASFDVTSHLIDAELNCQTHGARIRVHSAADLRFRLPELTNLMFLTPPQQVVVVQQQQVVRQKVVAAQVEFRKGNFSIALGFYKEVLVADPFHAEARQMVVQVETRNRRAEMEAARVAAWQRQQAALQAERDRQIALAAATEAARLQARRDAERLASVQRQNLIQQQIIAQQNLIAQAQLARRQNNLERRVALLESANGLRQNDAVVRELAEARAELAVEKQKRLAAERTAREAERQRQKEADLARMEQQLALERQKREAEQERRRRLEETRVQAEYDRFVDQGQKAMAAGKYPLAVTAFQNARRLRPSPEVEKLVSAALVEQAREEAEKKGAEERKRLEAQLAQEEQRRKQLEEQNARLRVKYQAALGKAQEAMRARRYQEAVESYKLANATLQTDEAAAGLRQAEAELGKAKVAAEAEARVKAEEKKRQAAVAQKVAEARTAAAARQHDKAVAAYKAAADLKPGDVDIQKALTEAELARDQAQAAARKQKEQAEQKAAVAKLMVAGQQNLRARQYDAAVVSFTDALKLDPEHREAKTGLAQAEKFLAARKSDTAAEAEAKRKREQYEQAMRQGRAAANLKRYADALGFFQKAQDLLPGDAASAQLIQDTQKQKHDAEAAAAAKKTAAELNQTLAAGRSALRANKFDEAQAAADRALKLDPASVPAKKLGADVDTARKAYAAAAQKKEPPAKKTSKANQLLTQARTAIRAKDLDTASRLLTEAAAADPTDPDLKRVQAEFEAARREMAAVPKTTPKVEPKIPPKADPKVAAYEVAVQAARDAFEAKQYETATQRATEALRLKPNDPAATQLLTAARKASADASAAAMEAKKKQDAYLAALRDASTAYAEKKYDDAAQAARVALANKPGDPAATKLLADSQKAVDESKAAAMAAQKKKQAYDLAVKTGRAALTRKDHDAAIKAFTEALAAVPNDPMATALLKQARDAQAAMAEEVQRREAYNGWMARARKLMTARQFEAAVEAYQNALKALPDDPAASRGLTEARAAMTKKATPKVEPKPKDPVPPKKEPPVVPKTDPPKVVPMPMPPVPPRKDPPMVPKKESPSIPKKDLPAVPKKEPPAPKVDPNAAQVTARLQQAAAAEKAGKYADALAAYQEVLKLAPTNAVARRKTPFCQHMDQGTQHLAAGRTAEAAASFQQAARLDPSDPNARRLLQQARVKKK